MNYEELILKLSVDCSDLGTQKKLMRSPRYRQGKIVSETFPIEVNHLM